MYRVVPSNVVFPEKDNYAGSNVLPVPGIEWSRAIHDRMHPGKCQVCDFGDEYDPGTNDSDFDVVGRNKRVCIPGFYSGAD